MGHGQDPGYDHKGGWSPRELWAEEEWDLSQDLKAYQLCKGKRFWSSLVTAVSLHLESCLAHSKCNEFLLRE